MTVLSVTPVRAYSAATSAPSLALHLYIRLCVSVRVVVAVVIFFVAVREWVTAREERERRLRRVPRGEQLLLL